jgi:hypothetical protein
VFVALLAALLSKDNVSCKLQLYFDFQLFNSRNAGLHFNSIGERDKKSTRKNKSEFLNMLLRVIDKGRAIAQAVTPRLSTAFHRVGPGSSPGQIM